MEIPLLRLKQFAVAEDIGRQAVKHSQVLVHLHRHAWTIDDGDAERVLPLIEGNFTQVTANGKPPMFRFDLESPLECADRNDSNSTEGFNPESKFQCSREGFG